LNFERFKKIEDDAIYMHYSNKSSGKQRIWCQ